jgi:hypothetical protein
LFTNLIPTVSESCSNLCRWRSAAGLSGCQNARGKFIAGKLQAAFKLPLIVSFVKVFLSVPEPVEQEHFAGAGIFVAAPALGRKIHSQF